MTTKMTDAEIEARDKAEAEAKVVADAALCAKVVADSGVGGFKRCSSWGESEGDGRTYILKRERSPGNERNAIEVCVTRGSSWRGTGHEIRVSWRWGRPEQTIRWDAKRPESVAKAAAKIKEFAARLVQSVARQAAQEDHERREEARLRAVAVRLVEAGLLPATDVEQFACNSYHSKIEGTVGAGPFPTVRWTVKFRAQAAGDGFVVIEDGVSAENIGAAAEIPAVKIQAALAAGNADAPVAAPTLAPHEAK